VREVLPPLHGLPITIKECLDLEGAASTFGLSRLAANIAAKDERHIARLRRDGAIILGKTNAGQLLLMLETSNPVYGRTNNPWNVDRSSGGSSGGHGETWRYWEQVERLMAYRERFLRALDEAEGGPINAVLCPAVALPAFVHGACRDLGLAGSYSMLANILGFPAGVVPLTRVRAGEEVSRRRSFDAVERAAHATEKGSTSLPIGVQIIARPWREDIALAVLSAIETAARTRSDFPFAPPLA
jgi:Asp-tRNA(Asn)/Glu-tRNA(Gln) amidotransferase A subunit family amidase